ncbi:MAG: aminotransferase class V-fold PLP-dependent enzyme [Clostridiales bacterium]|nr:aminotransferase class V-fold PLP-dependent enzyme [Clostridiales bacterium]
MSVRTPISDFIDEYAEKNMVRLHMPGHKGVTFSGPEREDITEIYGADSLYSAGGIIDESEKICSRLFNSKKTLYSTEGSSQCIKAMVYLLKYTRKHSRTRILATRNVHKSFLYACALCDCEVDWIYSEEGKSSVCSCKVCSNRVDRILETEEYDGVYITSPDYLGNLADVKGIAEVCHKHDVPLLVDNAHGAYLHFLDEKMHPLDLGADICCDSAHKTLPVLTGGAYLHFSDKVSDEVVDRAKDAMEMFGSTSPSYLVLKSLDLCNRYLDEKMHIKLKKMTDMTKATKHIISDNGWNVCESEPLKISIRSPKSKTGYEIAQMMRQHGVECEFCDKDFVTCMFSTSNSEDDVRKFIQSLGENFEKEIRTLPNVSKCEKRISIREAVFSGNEIVDVENAVGRICSDVKVSCPPAVPIVMPGEVIDEYVISLLKYYGITEIDVVK